jgi:hypothetical protein
MSRLIAENNSTFKNDKQQRITPTAAHTDMKGSGLAQQVIAAP